MVMGSILTTTPPRRQPKQTRSRALVDAIHQACIKIIESGRGDKLSVSLIAKTAGITLSSFYQYFPNIQSAVASTILKYDQDRERYDAIMKKLTGQSLTPLQAVELVIDALCDRHLRFLKKYGHVYQRYHRFINSQLCVGFDGEGLAKLVKWEDWLRHFLEVSCGRALVPTDMGIFIATTIFVELTAKAIDQQPRLLEDEAFRKILVNVLCNHLY